MMNILDAEKAIYKRIGQFKHTDTVVRIENQQTEDGQPFTAPKNKPWCKVYVQYANSMITGIGSQPCVRNQGIVSIQCFMLKNTGTLAMATLCDAWIKHLQNYQDSHLEFYLVHAPQYIDDPDFYAKIIRAEFRVN